MPPAAIPPDPAAPPGQYGFLFDRLGPRVPTVVISPYIERGTIFGAQHMPAFEHTSILATLRECFALGPPLSARDAAAPDLGFLLARVEPREDRPLLPPAPTMPALVPDSEATSGIAEIAVRVLRDLTGTQPRPGQSVTDFIHATYAAHFR